MTVPEQPDADRRGGHPPALRGVPHRRARRRRGRRDRGCGSAQPGPSTYDGMRQVVDALAAGAGGGDPVHLRDRRTTGEFVGGVEARPRGDVTSLSWWLFAGQRGRGYATRAVRLLAEHAIEHLGARRVQAEVDPRNAASLRVATRAGLRREGVQRVEPGMVDRADATGMVILARLASDPPLTEPTAFRALLNSLPPPQARDQPAPRARPRRPGPDLPAHLQARLGPAGRRGRGRRVTARRRRPRDRGGAGARPSTPATCSSPTGSRPGAAGTTRSAWSSTAASTTPSLLDPMVLEPREIRSAEFATLEQVRERCADFTARRITSALAVARGDARPSYVESGGT